MKKANLVHVKCRHCGYEWDSEGALRLVTCPSCGKKTPRVEARDR